MGYSSHEVFGFRGRIRYYSMHSEVYYLVAFGPVRHRAWVVGQRALECWLGSRGRSFWGLLEAVLKRLGGCFEASWGLLWASWGPLLGLLGASWGPWGLLGESVN